MGRKTSRGTTQFSPARAGASLSQRSQMTIARSCHGLPPSVPTKQMLFADAFRAAALSCFFPGVRLPHSHLLAALCKSDFPATAALHSLVETCVSVELRLSYHLFRRLSSKKQWENNSAAEKRVLHGILGEEQLGGASADAQSYWQGRFAACTFVEHVWHTGRPWNCWGVAPNPTRDAVP